MPGGGPAEETHPGDVVHRQRPRPRPQTQRRHAELRGPEERLLPSSSRTYAHRKSASLFSFLSPADVSVSIKFSFILSLRRRRLTAASRRLPVQVMQQLYQECNLVHADLSEYNMLWHEGKVQPPCFYLSCPPPPLCLCDVISHPRSRCRCG